MLAQLLRALFHDEVEDLRRRSAGVGLEVNGAVILLLALVFAMVALFLWLAEGRPPWQAALIVAGLLLLLGVGVFLVGREMVRRKAEHAERARAADLGALGLLSQPRSGKRADDPDELPASLVPSALLIGIAIGRFLRR